MTEPDPSPDDALAAPARTSPRWRVGLGAAVVLLVIGVGVAVVAGLLTPGAGVRPVAALPPTPGAAVTPAPAVSTPAAALVVHVLGQVNRPGVYELPDGARAIDAIGAAGGLTPSADPSGLNLARPLVDGEQLLVPRPGEAPPPAIGADAGGAASPGGATAPGGKVELNAATLEQLETLPRIGPSLAQRILDWRQQNGRFASVDDLKNVSGIGDRTFAGLKDQVTVR